MARYSPTRLHYPWTLNQVCDLKRSRGSDTRAGIAEIACVCFGAKRMGRGEGKERRKELWCLSRSKFVEERGRINHVYSIILGVEA